jgi:hypothetical protein
VTMEHKGSIMTLDLDEFVVLEKVAAHADTVDKLLTGTAPTDFEEATLRECVAREGKRYALLHLAVSPRLHVYFEPRLTRNNFKRYFQLEMDPNGERVLPIKTVRAGDPYWRMNPETRELEGVFFAFIYDIPDPNGDLRAETLDSFENVDAFAACRAVEPQTPLSPGQTRAGLLVPIGAIPPKLTANIDVWRRRWVRLDECRVINLFFNPKNCYRPRSCSPASTRRAYGRRRATTTISRARSWAPTRNLPPFSRTGRCLSTWTTPACGRLWTAPRTKISSSTSPRATGHCSSAQTTCNSRAAFNSSRMRNPP